MAFNRSEPSEREAHEKRLARPGPVCYNLKGFPRVCCKKFLSVEREHGAESVIMLAVKVPAQVETVNLV
jgi:hypothetical protein